MHKNKNLIKITQKFFLNKVFKNIEPYKNVKSYFTSEQKKKLYCSFVYSRTISKKRE